MTSVWLALVVSTTSPVGGCARAGIAAPTPPVIGEAAPEPGPYAPLRGFDPDLPLGIGHLRAVRWDDWPWWMHVRLPLFRSPGEAAPFAWIADGWLHEVTTGSNRPFGVEGLVETGYEDPSFLVHESRPDGWLEIRYGPEPSARAWVHPRFFETRKAGLAYESWAERLTDDEISPLFFRREVRHALRAAPERTAPLVRWIPAASDAYAIRPLEVRGEWMRVQVTVPSDYCVDPEVGTTVAEGWVVWRDDARGPWLFYFTRGC